LHIPGCKPRRRTILKNASKLNAVHFETLIAAL
jgi:hypothetical protein